MTQRIKKAAQRAFSDAEQLRRERGDHVVILDKYVPWTEHVALLDSNAYYVVFPGSSGNWMLQCVPTSGGSFAERVPLPEGWAGLPHAELVQATGISDAIFCYADRFIAGAKSKDAAIEMAAAALAQQFKDERVGAARSLLASFKRIEEDQVARQHEKG